VWFEHASLLLVHGYVGVVGAYLESTRVGRYNIANHGASFGCMSVASGMAGVSTCPYRRRPIRRVRSRDHPIISTEFSTLATHSRHPLFRRCSCERSVGPYPSALTLRAGPALAIPRIFYGTIPRSEAVSQSMLALDFPRTASTSQKTTYRCAETPLTTIQRSAL